MLAPSTSRPVIVAALALVAAMTIFSMTRSPSPVPRRPEPIGPRMRVPRKAIPTAARPTPPPHTSTRAELIALIRTDPRDDRYFKECWARGGHACCGQGGCCGLVETPIAANVDMPMPVVIGPVATEKIERVLLSLGQSVQHCYEHELPELTIFDSVSINLHIPTAGPITSELDGFDQAVAECVDHALHTAPFPRSSGPVDVRATFSFVARG